MPSLKKLLKQLIIRTPVYFPLRSLLSRINDKKQFRKWMNSNLKTPPPHIVKQLNLKSHAESFNLKVFVETGTYYGDMVAAMKTDFEIIYSIELSRELFEMCQKRFKNHAHIRIMHGDSGKILKDVFKNIHQPALFWLDGHFSEGETAKGSKITPIFEELNVILDKDQPPHVSLIDDARLFGTDPAYPSMSAIQSYMLSKRKHLNIILRDDAICVTPS